MAEPSTSTSPCPRCVVLERRIAALEAQVAELQSPVQRLTHLLEQATRATKRQAAPLSKGEPKTDPKPPGRKSGPDYAMPASRAAPTPGKPDPGQAAALPGRCPT